MFSTTRPRMSSTSSELTHTSMYTTSSYPFLGIHAQPTPSTAPWFPVPEPRLGTSGMKDHLCIYHSAGPVPTGCRDRFGICGGEYHRDVSSTHQERLPTN